MSQSHSRAGQDREGRQAIAPIKLGQNGLPRVTLKSTPAFPAFVGPGGGTLQRAAPAEGTGIETRPASPSCSDLLIWREAPVNPPGSEIASRFYEALRHELEESLSRDDVKRAALIAANDRCERIAAASINPTALLDELRKAIAVLEDDTHPLMSPPTKARPVLRVIEGGHSNV